MGTSGQLIGYYLVKWVMCEMQHLSKRGHPVVGLSNWSTVYLEHCLNGARLPGQREKRSTLLADAPGLDRFLRATKTRN